MSKKTSQHLYVVQVNGYVLIVGNNIAHLPLTSLRVIRGKSLLDVRVPPYVTTTTAARPTTTPGIYGGLKADVWNVTRVHTDVEWKNGSVEDRTDNQTTTSDGRDDERLLCSLFVASNVKGNSTNIGLREVHLTSLHGQLNRF